MKTAMILAAGRGERLKPITLRCPKAMCRVANLPILEYHVKKLVRAGVERIVINHAYLGHFIRQHFRDGRAWNVEIIYSPEQPGGLETGGGIYNALPLLGSEPFITVNADVYSDYDFLNLQLKNNELAHLVLISNPLYKTKADFNLDQQRCVTSEDKQYTYSGIACYHPSIFTACHPGRYSVIKILRPLIEQRRVGGSLYNGLWVDIGSLERLRYANQIVLPSV